MLSHTSKTYLISVLAAHAIFLCHSLCFLFFSHMLKKIHIQIRGYSVKLSAKTRLVSKVQGTQAR